MADEPRKIRFSLKSRQTRFRIYFLILLALLAVIAWKYIPRPWTPTLTLETPHHTIYSTATRPQTEEIARTLDLLYTAYSNRFGNFEKFQPNHPKLKLKLFKDRKQLRKTYPSMGWAEAFYLYPYCHAYYSEDEINTAHWMLHECVHQLNNEVAHLDLSKWLEEGLSEYFSTSRIGTNGLTLGRIDPNTYPVWWIDDLATAPDLAENLRNGSVIPLRAIITDHGGPAMRTHVNLYYLHWWTLTHFIFETPKYRDKAPALVQQGGTLDTFEKLIGPVDQIQTEWHTYIRRLKAALNGNDPAFLRQQH